MLFTYYVMCCTNSERRHGIFFSLFIICWSNGLSWTLPSICKCVYLWILLPSFTRPSILNWHSFYVIATVGEMVNNVVGLFFWKKKKTCSLCLSSPIAHCIQSLRGISPFCIKRRKMQKKKNNETSNECKTQIVASFNWKRVNVYAKQHEKKLHHCECVCNIIFALLVLNVYMWVRSSS